MSLIRLCNLNQLYLLINLVTRLGPTCRQITAFTHNLTGLCVTNNDMGIVSMTKNRSIFSFKRSLCFLIYSTIRCVVFKLNLKLIKIKEIIKT